MIIFQKERYIKQLLKTGIKPDEKQARYLLRCVASYLKNCTTYRPSVAMQKMKEVSAKYFRDMPDSYVDGVIEDIYGSVKSDEKEILIDNNENVIEVDENSNCFDKTALIYKSEMDKICALPNENLKKLAFVLLVYAKSCGKKWVSEHNADLIAIAEVNISSGKKNEYFYRLTQNGMVCFQAFPNWKYRSGKNGNATNMAYTIPYQVEFMDNPIDNDVAVMQITHFDDMLLYYRRYIGDPSITDCIRCGAPIVKTSNSRKYCADCAEKVKHSAA